MFNKMLVRDSMAVATITTFLILALSFSSVARAQFVLPLTSTGAGSVTIPAGYEWANVMVQCWGGGGAGMSGAQFGGGGGGGGGAYAYQTYTTPLVAGAYSYYVGNGGGGGYVGESTIWYGSGINALVQAGGGGGGSGNSPGGGGLVLAGTGYPGGDGGSGWYFCGGGGGGSGGPSGPGGQGGNSNGYAAGGGAGYGPGGSGGGADVGYPYSDNPGGGGGFPGGGGGGAYIASGGGGGNGEIIITYTPAYLGNLTWSASGGGSWGTLTSNFGKNWGGAAYGSPGFDPNFPGSATLGVSATSGTAVVTLDGANPNLAQLTFNNSAASYTIASGSGGVLHLNGGTAAAALSDLAGSHSISAPMSLDSGAIVTVTNPGDTLAISGPISGSGGLTTNGVGTVILTASNFYTGGTTIVSGTLQGNTASLPGTISNNAALVFNQPGVGTFGGSITGSGSLGVTGGGQITLAGADTLASSGPIAVNQGTLAAPLGISHAGAGITLASAGTLQGGGEINRAVSGNGTVTAAGQLIIGNAAQTGQFNQGGVPGAGGTLDVGSNAVVILSADAAVLGSQTNIGPGGSLTALHGAQLGNPSSVDPTKMLTATGSATINADFINNGVVNGPTGSGQELTFTQYVTGAGTTTGNVEYQASYHVGNSPDAVSVQNVLLDPTSTLIMELDGTTPGSGYDQLDISGLATLNGALDVELLNGFTPSAGQSFDLFNGSTTGRFAQISLPTLSNGLSWNTSNIYSTGEISVVPEPSTLVLLAAGAIGLIGWAWRRRRKHPMSLTGESVSGNDQEDSPAILSLRSRWAGVARRAA